MTIKLVISLLRRIEKQEIRNKTKVTRQKGRKALRLTPKTTKMQLTKAEEQVMQILWDLENGLVKDIRESFPEPKPARNTVSTVVRILEKKGFVGHKAYGNVYLYHPLVSRSEYSKSQLFGLMEGYFNNSFPAMASFFAREKDLTMKELEELLDDTRRELKKDKKKK
jgi:BlaI family penicillinase repressor